MTLELGLIWLHVLANVVWIGSILAVAVICSAKSGEPKVRGEIATTVYLRLAAPAFVASFTFGLVRLLMDRKYYLSEHHWMHGKLLFALGVIALHHIIGARAKKLAKGDVQEASGTATLGILLAVSAAVAVFFAILKLPG